MDRMNMDCVPSSCDLGQFHRADVGLDASIDHVVGEHIALLRILAQALSRVYFSRYYKDR